MPLHRYKERNQTGAFIAVADPFNIAYEIGKEIKVSEPGGVGHAAERKHHTFTTSIRIYVIKKMPLKISN
jgi:hypothetical protein